MTDPRIEKIARALAMLNVESDDNWKLYIQDAEAALSAIGQVWQQIDTAPKDGSYFLAYFPLNGLHDRWCRVVPIYYTSAGEYIFASRSASGFSKGFEPTHWMPLPDAPKP